MQEFIDLRLSARVKHPDGYVIVPARISRTGVQAYHAYELDLDGDPMRLVNVYRPAEEVFAPASLKTADGAPITNEHNGRVEPKNWKKLASGFVRNPRAQVDHVAADLTFAAQDAIDALDSGKNQFSAGYTADLEWTAGVHDGKPYEAIQRNIRINHVALLRAGRCGPTCSISDSQPDGGPQMATRKIVLDGIPLDLDDVAAAAVEKVSKQLTDAQTTIEGLRTQLGAKVKYGDADLPISNPGAITAVIADLSKRLDDQSKDVMTPQARDAMVADWVKTIDLAKRLAPKITTDGKTCAALRREVVSSLYEGRKALVDAVLAGVAVKDAPDEAVRTAFAVLGSSAPESSSSQRKTDAVADAMSKGFAKEQQDAAGGGNGNGEPKHAVTEDGLPDPDAARANWMKAQRGRFRTQTTQ